LGVSPVIVGRATPIVLTSSVVIERLRLIPVVIGWLMRLGLIPVVVSRWLSPVIVGWLVQVIVRWLIQTIVVWLSPVIILWL